MSSYINLIINRTSETFVCITVLNVPLLLLIKHFVSLYKYTKTTSCTDKFPTIFHQY